MNAKPATTRYWRPPKSLEFPGDGSGIVPDDSPGIADSVPGRSEARQLFYNLDLDDLAADCVDILLS